MGQEGEAHWSDIWRSKQLWKDSPGRHFDTFHMHMCLWLDVFISVDTWPRTCGNATIWKWICGQACRYRPHEHGEMKRTFLRQFFSLKITRLWLFRLLIQDTIIGRASASRLWDYGVAEFLVSDLAVYILQKIRWGINIYNCIFIITHISPTYCVCVWYKTKKTKKKIKYSMVNIIQYRMVSCILLRL
jgi:hypothetical protein